MDNRAALDELTTIRRKRDNALALLLMLFVATAVVFILWMTNLIVFIPIVVGVALYALIARFFFFLFRVPVPRRASAPVNAAPPPDPSASE